MKIYYLLLTLLPVTLLAGCETKEDNRVMMQEDTGLRYNDRVIVYTGFYVGHTGKLKDQYRHDGCGSEIRYKVLMDDGFTLEVCDDNLLKY